jgi:hypothetical protein
MRNKTTNFIIVITGTVLFYFPSWFVNQSIFTDTDNGLLISCSVSITGAILVLLAIINFISILFAKSFENNKTQMDQIVLPDGEKIL